MKPAKPRKFAAGLPSVLKTTEKALKDMGPGRTLRVWKSINQKTGFDCPGCAWPESDQGRHSLEFCENGSKAVSDEATRKRVTPEFFAHHSIQELAAQSDVWLNAQGRLTQPMLLREGGSHYEPVSWDDAFGLIASELTALPSPDRAIFYTSGRTSNEAAFLYQLFVRKFGTNNLPDCSNLCHESSGVGLRESIGVGKGTVTLEDFAKSDAIFILGQNPGSNHPRMLATLQAARLRGCEIVAINPLPEAGLIEFRHPQTASGLLGFGTALATQFVPVRINGDVAFLKGLCKEILEEEQRRPGEVLDSGFIRQQTSGFSTYVEALARVSWDEIIESSGVDRNSIREAAAVAVRSKATIVCWAMGLTQHENAVANVQEIANFLLLRGMVGKPGAGACPVRGHSNVQGDRTMGIWERMPDAFLDRLGVEFAFRPPRHHGMDTVQSIRAMLDGRASVFFAMGGNFLSASPDTDQTSGALRACSLTVHVSTKLNRAHVTPGRQALILPCLGRTEIDLQSSGPQCVTTENSMGVISRSQGVLEPASQNLQSEIAIVVGLAKAMLKEDWSRYVSDYGLIRDRIEKVVPGFERYNQRIAETGSFLLPNAARDRHWNTPTGKANFTVHELPAYRLTEGELIMMTIRSHDQFNTTIYSDDDRYRGIFGGRRVVLLNQNDMLAMGLEEGELVDLVSLYKGVERVGEAFRVMAYPIPPRCAATYFPEANVLVPLDSTAARSNTPASKSVVIRVRLRVSAPTA